jgi:hypothetical protein
MKTMHTGMMDRGFTVFGSSYLVLLQQWYASHEGKMMHCTSCKPQLEQKDVLVSGMHSGVSMLIPCMQAHIC